MDTRLSFYWYEIKPDETLGARWAQVIEATHRLRFVCDELTKSATEPEIEKALEHLAYNAENYLVRAYELRERVVSLIVMLSGASPDALKKPQKRKSAIANVRKTLLKVASPLDRFLAALDDDIKLRNFHTHDTFLRIGLWGENALYEPADALLDLHDLPKHRKRLEALLRKEAKRLAREYERKANRVIRTAMSLVKSVGPRLRPRSANTTSV